MPRPRNPFALHPLMRKGGAHTRSATTLRAGARRDCEEEAAAYLEERAARVDDRMANEDNGEVDCGREGD